MLPGSKKISPDGSKRSWVERVDWRGKGVETLKFSDEEMDALRTGVLNTRGGGGDEEGGSEQVEGVRARRDLDGTLPRAEMMISISDAPEAPEALTPTIPRIPKAETTVRGGLGSKNQNRPQAENTGTWR